MIESIEIKNVATYDETGIQINDLKKVNFIYGANGSGKTTISNLLQTPTESKFHHCSINWYNSEELTTLVYNKNFRDNNFGKGKLNGIFTLGEATKEQKRVIDEKTEQLKQIKTEGEKIRFSLNDQKEKIDNIDQTFTDFAWNKIFKKYKEIFKEAFAGSMRSGELFKNRLIQEFANNSQDLQSYEELKGKAATIFGEIPKEIIPINNIDYSRISEIEKAPVWKKIIVGKADVEIAKLIQKLNMNDWVNTGRSFIQIDNDLCPFCQQQTIDKNFRSQIENFFDETYTKDIDSLKSLRQEYGQLFENFINELNSIESTQKNFKESKLDIEKFSSYLKTLISQNTTNSEYLNSKIKEPSRKIELLRQSEQLKLILELIQNANDEIKNHNDIVKDYANQRSNLISAIWKYLITEFQADIETYTKSKTGLEKGYRLIDDNLKVKLKNYRILFDEIKQLSKDVTSIQPTIDEINPLLYSFGFLNFKIVPASEEGFYQIQREDGTIAEDTLSEGEITFITFLYFLQRAKGGTSEDNVNDERILVIDDPISSLDSNVLFIVSTLIKEILKAVKLGSGNIKQVILLTHNIYFHKEVSFEGLHRKGEKPVFWILRKNNSISKIQSYFEQNPIQSSYEILWRDIKEWENNSGTTVQNTMRRILENFFSILGNNRDDFLISKFETQEEREICRSLLSWINEGSHTLPDDLYVEAPDGTIENYLKVFKEIFKLTENIGHYNMMMGIAESNDEETN